MSLNWSTEKCKHGNAAEDERSARDALVFATMAVDIGKIDDKNIDEWMFRLAYLKRVGLAAFDEPDGHTLADLRSLLCRWVGLSTNVSTATRASFMKKVVRQIESDIKYEISYAKKEVTT